MARKPRYTQEELTKIIDEICERIVGGQSLNSILKNEEYPSYTRLMVYFSENKELRDKYVRAKENSADADHEKLSDIAEKVLKGTYDANQARVAADIIKWSMGKKKPKKYGDRSHLSIEDKTPKNDLSEEERKLRILELQKKLGISK